MGKPSGGMQLFVSKTFRLPLAAWTPAIPALLFLAVFFFVPVVEILLGGFTSTDGNFSLVQFGKLAGSPVYAKVLWVTFYISALTALLSVGLGYPLAYLLNLLGGRTRDRWLLWIMLPFWTSYIVKTYAWMLLLSRSGVLSSMAAELGLIGHGPGIVPSLTGVLIGMVHGLLPLAVLTMLPIMQGIGNQLPKAAETLGAGRATGFFTVFLPLSTPGMAAAGLLVFIISLGFFVVPALLGTPQQTMVAQMVISAVQELFDLRFAGALATVLLLCSIIVFFVYDRFVGLSSLAGEAGRGARGSRWTMQLLFALGRLAEPFVRWRPWRIGPLKLYGWVVVLFLVLPVLIVIPIAFTRKDFVSFPPSLFSLRWFYAFIDSPVWRAALLRSFRVGFATAALSVVLGLGASFALTRLPPRWTKLLFVIFVAPLIVPRIVLAIGLLYLLSDFGLIGTDIGLVIGHTVLAIPYVIVTLSAGLRQVDWQLDDAAKILGASAFMRVRTILLPMLAASIASAFLFAFIVSFDDVTIAIFVSGGINTTLPKQMWDNIQLAVSPTLAAVSTVLIVLVAIVIYLASLLKSRTS